LRSPKSARKRGAGGTATDEDLFWIEEAQSYLCFYCSTPLPLESVIHLEHKTPLSRGGSNGPENLALACAPCNLSKGAKTAQEFMEMKGGGCIDEFSDVASN